MGSRRADLCASRRALARYLLHDGRITQAIGELDTIRAIFPNDRDTQLALVESYIGQVGNGNGSR